MTDPAFNHIALKRLLSRITPPSLISQSCVSPSDLLRDTETLMRRAKQEMENSTLKAESFNDAEACLGVAHKLLPKLEECRICPRKCGANRFAGNKGICGFSSVVRLASQVIHIGEEPPLSGQTGISNRAVTDQIEADHTESGPVIHFRDNNIHRKGSGTLFFSGCTLKCSFCQNYPISHMGHGRDMSILDLGLAMLDLQRKGAYNINLVTGSHFLPQIALAAALARSCGLEIPIVLNSSGYDLVETMKICQALLQIHLPDCKYSSDTLASKFSGVTDYREVNVELLTWIAVHSGPLKTDRNGIAISGALVRHLVLPSQLQNSIECLDFLATLRPKLPISLMFQYFQPRPGHGPEGKVSSGEYKAVLARLENLGLKGYVQELAS
ncbi:MAG: radical SAM protein [Candidatus Wallbacteria bacterium HGW-Wallbacteria-1]|jgi:putative pyruvate formate lyase activating enzyme|uniref:Radical SAM protein n=1 Tax=Candidatus Wallbacteria bacterium HGW-Wallbacteria-1 TaxID=2013854 RepID=A0A2N1PLX2_9BACT|nr:MAG: radical SAM protein [Candidatus Wallbacteria bacterium HGW-Wallbacteria-1]